MAILGKIQRSSGALILVIGLAMFAFIIMDLLKNGATLFRPSTEYVGIVNGEKIPTDEFNKRKQALQQQYGPNASESQLMKTVWDQFIREKLFESQYKKSGIIIPSERIYDRIKNDPGIQRMFTNEQGIFDENALMNYLDEINASKDENNPDYDAWKNYQDNLKRTEGERIYTALVKGAINPTIKEGAWEYHKENDKVSFEFVVAPYSLIPDSTVSITEKDVKDYIARHEDLYQTEASKDVQYVIFEYKPSETDYERTKEELKELIRDKEVYDRTTGGKTIEKGFATVNADEVDQFIKSHSDEFKPAMWKLENEIPAVVRDTLMKLPVGAVYGPVRTPGKLTLYKVVDRRENVPVKAKASHILIPFKGALNATTELSEEQAKQKADSLYQIIKRNPQKFSELAKEHSTDFRSAQNGGDLGEFSFGRMVDAFNDFVFSGKKGKTGIVKTDYGYHIIKIDDLSDEKSNALKIAELVREVTPSEATIDSIYTVAVEYFSAAKKAGDLNKVEKDKFIKPLPIKKIKRFETRLPGLGEQPAIVSWLYNDKTETGDMRRFELTQGEVIVQVTGETEKGLMPVSEAMVLVKPILLKKKKFELLKEKMKGQTLDEIAENSGGQKGKADGVSLASPLIPSFGNEPKVVAVAFITPEGKISDPVEGNFGAYVVRTTQVNKAKEIDNYYNYIAELERKEEANLLNRIVEALKKKAEIKDNRVILGY